MMSLIGTFSFPLTKLTFAISLELFIIKSTLYNICIIIEYDLIESQVMWTAYRHSSVRLYKPICASLLWKHARAFTPVTVILIQLITTPSVYCNQMILDIFLNRCYVIDFGET